MVGVMRMEGGGRDLDRLLGYLGAATAVLAVLAGSLGGRADSQALVRGVLFLDEET